MMHVVEFNAENLPLMKAIAEAIIEKATFSVRVAVDVDGFKVSIDHGSWSPGYGEKK